MNNEWDTSWEELDRGRWAIWHRYVKDYGDHEGPFICANNPESGPVYLYMVKSLVPPLAEYVAEFPTEEAAKAAAELIAG